jgi:hypothetical protein
MGFQMSQPAEAAHVSASHCLDGAIQNIAAPPPRKIERPRNAQKGWKRLEHPRAIPESQLARKSRQHAPLAPMRSTPAYLFSSGGSKLN